MKKRVFVAIGISEELKGRISQWQNKFSTLPVRWIGKKNLHVTIIPPWYEENVEKVKQAIQEAVCHVGFFDLQFHRITFGPSQNRPRLIWIEGPSPKKLIDLTMKLEKVLRKKSERRSFLLHLTVARFKPEIYSTFSIKQLDEKVLWNEKVASVVLMESRLLKGGADYESIAACSLQ
ncbi:MAG: 2'-5' RNA ligase [Candidatus Ryanbacteria bacterium RIFCSPHIGHO2_02_FULL_45_43]|uniref:RNA 2',3'-cyclic phosphodiesterase n=1 Tax=Candidatus Ryanbacteria bacterium RIFCSPHIGHO2_01_45_13 TaxID=1802112 RepID=A0A1G2G1L2_9BACT|nr:MAG: 2'-5' RNA ligase [Candidatus Ryanbacteria bacterium RIFCSPHIGHO2_01_FULL_44_130]OGZ43760.1 MAG: 2'-5' RNA ligase [Candidatus Ryanbacteria bacterium RIFCSPHIGHO2_01_45_13]OGZ47702.1 MAG: 2'-5' RNA ligase [Candidatus Ryanbacteria bacterium RIFCSPHIGHO2_02_FULL_45_43]OGZ49598.1 MAG: 2'-5' RNA ligase [Candidatus Ryanbacteria bacterium RIFCSPHIGHO2_12_FULL_44_20]OGZ51280.1 MAG: 2'-5' RNA ligase [Candidatus Ryanbacteria bacterium RIFCSPLOWO2_01_FULL_44_230]OGZ54021.1 MAG: 2'-5' RNA ligase [C